MEYFLGILALLLGGVGVWLNGKKNIAESKAEQAATKLQVADLNNKIAANNQSLSDEVNKRNELETNAQKEENKDVSQEDILKFLNPPDSK